MRILLTGDVCPGGVLAYQDTYITQDLLSYIRSFDIRVGTLESAIGDTYSFDAAKMKGNKAIVYSRDLDFKRIIELGFDVVTLANNHTTDLGIEGLLHTIELVKNSGILYCGAGKNLAEARKPAVIERDGCSVAFIGCLFKDQKPIIYHPATNTSAGVYQASLDDVVEDIKIAKTKYDIVVVLPHWAQEHIYMPRTYCIEYAKTMIKAGADIIIGSHPHIINPVISIDGKKVYFSLGNFLFPDKCLEVPRPMTYDFTKKMLSSAPREWNYPESVSVPTVSVWRGYNRVGMAVELDICNKSISSDRYRLVALGADNILRFHQGYNVFMKRIRLFLFGCAIKSKWFNLIRRWYIHDKFKLRKFIHKVSDRCEIYYDVKVKL